MPKPTHEQSIDFLARFFATPGVSVDGDRIVVDVRKKEAVLLMSQAIPYLNSLLDSETNAYAIRQHLPAAPDAAEYMSKSYDGELGRDKAYQADYEIGRNLPEVRKKWHEAVSEVKALLQSRQKPVDNISGHGGMRERLGNTAKKIGKRFLNTDNQNVR